MWSGDVKSCYGGREAECAPASRSCQSVRVTYCLQQSDNIRTYMHYSELFTGSGVLFRRPCCQILRKSSNFCGTRSLGTNSLPLDPIPSQINLVHSSSAHTYWTRSLNCEKRLLDSSSSEISPTRCNNCFFSPQWLYSTCFW